MLYKTPHGLKPANEFLRDAIMQEAGTECSLQYHPNRHGFDNGSFYLVRKGDTRLIRIFAHSFLWKQKNQGPADVDWSVFPLKFYPSIMDITYVRPTIDFELQGIESVPGLSRTRGLPHTALNDSKQGFYLTSSPLIKEYKRRQILETAVLLREQVERRIQKHRTAGPFMLDQ